MIFYVQCRLNKVCGFIHSWTFTVLSLKQQSVGGHVAALRHIILIPSQPVFALSP
jgi:hypothetical protein